MKSYSIEMWSTYHDAWIPLAGCPTKYPNRAKAEEQLRYESAGRRCRLLNSKGKVVLHAGAVASECFILERFTS